MPPALSLENFPGEAGLLLPRQRRGSYTVGPLRAPILTGESRSLMEEEFPARGVGGEVRYLEPTIRWSFTATSLQRQTTAWLVAGLNVNQEAKTCRRRGEGRGQDGTSRENVAEQENR